MIFLANDFSFAVTVPGPPVGILFPEVRTTSVRLIWQPPAQPNGIILGEFTISRTSTIDLDSIGRESRGWSRQWNFIFITAFNM